MLLAIDVGNTNTVFGIYRDKELIGSFRLSTTAERTSDEIGMQIHMYYTFLGLQISDTKAVIRLPLGTTEEQAREMMQEMAKKGYGIKKGGCCFGLMYVEK